jgi:hypothetical protein
MSSAPDGSFNPEMPSSMTSPGMSDWSIGTRKLKKNNNLTKIEEEKII